MSWNDFLFKTVTSSCIDFIGYRAASEEIFVSFNAEWDNDFFHCYCYPGSIGDFEQLFNAASYGRFVAQELRPLGNRNGDLRELTFNIDSMLRDDYGYCADALPIEDVAAFSTLEYTSRVCVNEPLDVYAGMKKFYIIVPDFFPKAKAVKDKYGLEFADLYGLGDKYNLITRNIPGAQMVNFRLECMTFSILTQEECEKATTTYASGDCIFETDAHIEI